MSAQIINIVISPFELFHSIVPEVDIPISKGLKVCGSTIKKPLGNVEKLIDTENGNYHIKQVIPDLSEDSFGDILKDIIAIKNEDHA